MGSEMCIRDSSLVGYEEKFNFKVINPTPLRNKSIVISSSLIRKLLIMSKLNLVRKYLKRNWSIQGTVQVGRKLGRKIGFPTCNLDIKDYIIPKLGVYKVKVKIANSKKIYNGIANLGLRPTFNQKKILLEVNIFNFSKNLILFNRLTRKKVKRAIALEFFLRRKPLWGPMGGAR